LAFRAAVGLGEPGRIGFSTLATGAYVEFLPGPELLERERR